MIVHCLALLVAAAPSTNVDLLRSAIDPNPTLRSYIAVATLSARAHAVLSVRRRRRPSGAGDARDLELSRRRNANIRQQYETIGTYRVPSKIDIWARFPGYSIDGVVRFRNIG